jgi:two-component system, chemotaxis family, chemotaxis protein CheY
MALDVLVVDDSSMTRKMIIRVLKIAGIPIGSITEAEDGVDGLEKLEAGAHGLAILDINMPRMNGLELLERLRATARFADLPVLVVSTEGSEARVEHVRSQRAGFIRKPFAPEALVEAVVDAIGGVL